MPRDDNLLDDCLKDLTKINRNRKNREERERNTHGFLRKCQPLACTRNPVATKDNTMARQQNRTERISSVIGGRPQYVDEQRESSNSYLLAIVTTLPTANVGVTRTRWLGKHAIDVATQKGHPGGENGKSRDCVAEQLEKPGGNGATPALDNMSEGIAHREDQNVGEVDPNRRDLEKRLPGRVGVERHQIARQAGKAMVPR